MTRITKTYDDYNSLKEDWSKNRSIVNDALHSTLFDPYSGSKSYQNMGEIQVASPANPSSHHRVVIQG